MQLERPNKPIKQSYFLESGFASVVANGTGESIEVGMIGREGVTALAVVMETDSSPYETYIQAAGNGLEMDTARLRAHMEASPSMRACLLQFAHTSLVQLGQTCLANGRNKLEERLARWLLMAHDRLGPGDLALTHEFLGTMLGVRRPGVTIAIKLLESKGLISTGRSRIVVVDRGGLEAAANGAYGVPEAEYRRLFGSVW
jgi:CRP-like cAMP-binding protein